MLDCKALCRTGAGIPLALSTLKFIGENVKPSDIDFLIIGAAKCATTWLQKSLQADSSVMMPDPELHYFSREYARGDAWYMSHFDAAQPSQIIGEKSNSYLDTSGCATLIRAAMPDAKLVAQLRNPVDRAYSDYCMLYRRGEVTADIDSYLDPARAAGNRFLNGGQYATQIQDFLNLFPREQLLVVFFEDMKTNPNGQLQQVREFIGLPPEIQAAAVGTKVKDKQQPMLHPGLRRKLQWMKPIVAPFRETRLFKNVWNSLASEIKYPPLPQKTRSSLAQYYAEESVQLQRLIGRVPESWLSRK